MCVKSDVHVCMHSDVWFVYQNCRDWGQFSSKWTNYISNVQFCTFEVEHLDELHSVDCRHRIIWVTRSAAHKTLKLFTKSSLSFLKNRILYHRPVFNNQCLKIFYKL